MNSQVTLSIPHRFIKGAISIIQFVKDRVERQLKEHHAITLDVVCCDGLDRTDIGFSYTQDAACTKEVISAVDRAIYTLNFKLSQYPDNPGRAKREAKEEDKASEEALDKFINSILTQENK